jgi:hypothetical protein
MLNLLDIQYFYLIFMKLFQFHDLILNLTS